MLKPRSLSAAVVERLIFRECQPSGSCAVGDRCYSRAPDFRSSWSGQFYARIFTESLSATPTMTVALEVASRPAVEGDAMLKTATLFFVCSLAIALFAPQLLSYGIKPRVDAAGAAVVAPAPMAAQRVVAEESAGSREAILRPNLHGQYFVDVLINGQIVPMVYWHCLFERFLDRWREARSLQAVPRAAPELQAQAQRG